MAETVTITKQILVEETVSADVEVRVWKVACAKGHADELSFSVSADADGDLLIEVDPCDHCMKKAAEEAT